MNSAILFITGEYETGLAKAELFDKYLIEYTVSELKRLDIDPIYLVGDIDIDNVIRRDSLQEVFEELRDTDGKCLLLSPFYPLIGKEDYERLLEKEENAVFVVNEEEIVPVFAIYDNLLSSYDRLSYEAVEIEEDKTRRFVSYKDTAYFNEVFRKKINDKWLDKGVIIIDPQRTAIGADVFIDKDTCIHPDVVIEGKCIIGKDNIIGRGSHLKDVVIGDSNRIDDSIVKDSVIHNGCKIGPRAIIEEGSELLDEVTIGTYTKLVNTRIALRSSIDHLSYIGDGQIAEHVKIGTGVSTVNYDGRSRHSTNIRSHSTIGSNVTIIAPVNIGEYAMVAAGSVIDEDVKDGDMAIARIYQQNKKGYGYKYNKED